MAGAPTNYFQMTCIQIGKRQEAAGGYAGLQIQQEGALHWVLADPLIAFRPGTWFSGRASGPAGNSRRAHSTGINLTHTRTDL